MYSSVTGSSTVSLWLWHSTLALFTKILASAVKPTKKIRTKKPSRKAFLVCFKKYFITCKSHHNVVIQWTNFSDGSRFLKFGDRLSLYSENDNVFTPNSNLKHKISLLLNLQQNKRNKYQWAFVRNLRKDQKYEVFFTYSGRTFLHGFLCIFHLKEMPIRWKYGYSSIVRTSWHSV